ncbi:OmpA family protein [Brevundimonas sp.]|uniref:OmpA family protein n=1 Tax=Brevundimonas sp. TaxID=1871086 RepID=UPI002737C44B|nr:OmpA family protein [Brevundimonas sp.]MDP3800612.1 OmpA family protein [Brevundimonas sp.]
MSAAACAVFGPTTAGRAQHRILSAEQTVELEHDDRMARLRAAVDRLGMPNPPRFSVSRVPRERMPANFSVSAPVLRVAFSERTFFDTADWTILPQGLLAVEAVAAATRGEAPDAAVFVAGHTDDRGGEAYNHNLSVNRANAVSDALMRFGVGDVALWRVGFGESAPLYANDTDEHRGFNRRVEFLFGARVEPVVQVLSAQLDDFCISSSQAESDRCRFPLPGREAFEATQLTRRAIGIGMDGRAAAAAPGRPTRRAPLGRRPPRTSAPVPRTAQVTAAVPLTLTIPLRRTITIAAPQR